ncbi:hypothetical protein FNV43_RR27211 [Rhamnella rubrinervis]|uniref:Uncharacterized protein n=1 Tax=Rhamnella rubrinervis TaxID=2594499 RepID=A0A8K0DL83_9ROSA|nr:hypothetical protein FNV43_RR27211 [Rhamnella rubrinervis]
MPTLVDRKDNLGCPVEGLSRLAEVYDRNVSKRIISNDAKGIANLIGIINLPIVLQVIKDKLDKGE